MTRKKRTLAFKRRYLSVFITNVSWVNLARIGQCQVSGSTSHIGGVITPWTVHPVLRCAMVRPRHKPAEGGKRSNYITKEGALTLQNELDQLWNKERVAVTRAVAIAAAEGDRSENAEYIYGKKRLREIHRRSRYLIKRLDDLQVVDTAPKDRSRVFFGAWVTVEDEESTQHTFRIVGPDEPDPTRGYISIDSPIGKSLLRKSLDDEVEIRTPKGLLRYLIVDIHYEGTMGER